MIGSLRGALLDRGPNGDMIIEAAGTGVGYRVVPCAGALQTTEVGNEAFVWVHHHIREDAETLYAFADRRARETFVILIGTHGVGPSMALAILGVHSPQDLARIVLGEDLAALCLVPGVGKKTAARLLIELQSRLDLPDVVNQSTTASVDAGATVASTGALGDVRAALAELGYDGTEIAHVTRDLATDHEASTSELLKTALRRLGERS